MYRFLHSNQEERCFWMCVLQNFVFLSDTEDYPLNLVDFGSAAFFKSGEQI